jgi:hypothetical protein
VKPKSTSSATDLLTQSAQALRSYASFLKHFGLTEVQTDNPSPGLQRLRDEVARLTKMAEQLQSLAP